MSSTTADYLVENASVIITNIVDGITPNCLAKALKVAETNRFEDAPANEKDIWEQKIASGIFIETVAQLEKLLKGTTVNEYDSVQDSDLYEVRSALNNGVVVILHYTVTNNQKPESLKPFLITWEEKGASYKLEIP